MNVYVQPWTLKHSFMRADMNPIGPHHVLMRDMGNLMGGDPVSMMNMLTPMNI